MNIVSIGADSATEFNSDNWTRVLPARALHRAGHTVFMPLIDRWFKHDEEIKAQLARADIVIVQRVLVEESRERCRFWKERKKPILVSFDDSYANLKPEDGNQASKFWHDGIVDVHHPIGVSYSKRLDIHPLRQVEMAAQYISGFSMPSRILAEDWRWLAPCYYIPNFIDTPRYLPHRKSAGKRAGDELVIGWGGSLSHLNSFRRSGILEALTRVFKQRKNVKFLLAGDERIRPLLKLPAQRVIFQPYVLWSDWPKVMAKMDIVVAPLAGHYDASRSWIKCCEAGIMGIPCIASRSAPYQDWIDAGLGIFTRDDSDDMNTISSRVQDWEHLLIDVIDNYSEYRTRAEKEMEFSLSKDVDRNVKYIENMYEKIIANG